MEKKYRYKINPKITSDHWSIVNLNVKLVFVNEKWKTLIYGKITFEWSQWVDELHLERD